MTDEQRGERYERGRARFAAMWGDDSMDRFEENVAAVSPDLLRFMMEFVAGEVWTRDGLDPRTRSLVTVASLATSGRMRQLAEHIEGALNNGATEEEIVETLLHLAGYAGFPAAWDGIEVARRVFRTRHRRPGRSRVHDGTGADTAERESGSVK